ncbi:murein transglycosylase A [Aurantiacibacter spongiae]|uniref:murein transglycosylase A n=1 Tax=Aurantiacibacter spongiae TaxID=2488860 RepID=UPI001F38651A|nr:MltA domain-containing protein [Aurantiacibacter spongiae]
MNPARRILAPNVLGLVACVLLGACGRIIPESLAETPPPPGAQGVTAAVSSLARGPSIASLPLAADDAAQALYAFRESCPVAVSRADASGLTRPEDWREPCAAVGAWPATDAAGFFERYFVPVRVAGGNAFATGYFEPEIRGSRTRRSPTDVPVYAMPPDLVRAWPADTPESQREGRAPLGRYDENGDFVPYWDRAAIEEGALDGVAPVIAYAADPVEFFFLQIQGSGRLVTPEGDVIRIGYAGQNGRGYTGIGALMHERGLIGADTGYATSMQGIMAWLRDHPVQGRAIMRENQSWIFFRELTGDGPLGSIGVPVRGQSSVAVDPAFVPYGAPVWLDLDRTEADGLWVAQDTGGAIRGANRFDTFWGAGDEARAIAGGMSGRGEALIFLPRSAAARLGL